MQDLPVYAIKISVKNYPTMEFAYFMRWQTYKFAVIFQIKIML